MSKLALGGERVEQAGGMLYRFDVNLCTSKFEKAAFVKGKWGVFINRAGNRLHLVNGHTADFVSIVAQGGEAFISAEYVRTVLRRRYKRDFEELIKALG